MDATIIDLRGRLTPSRPAPQPEDRAALVRASRSGLGLTEEQFAVVLSQQVGWEVWPGHITAWEAGSARVLNQVAAACRRLAMNGTTSRCSFTQAELVLPAGPVTIEALRSMLASMAHGGRIALLGIPAGEVALDLGTVIFNMLTVKGIYGREMYETWYKMTVMLQSGLDITPVITHRYPFHDFEEGFDAMRSGQSGKVILTWSEG